MFKMLLSVSLFQSHEKRYNKKKKLKAQNYYNYLIFQQYFANNMNFTTVLYKTQEDNISPQDK